MSIMDLTGALQGLATQCGNTTTALATITDVAKDSVDPLTELTKLMGDDLPKAANFFKESYQVLVERLQKGDITVDQALESLRAMQRVLEQFGLKPGDVGDIDAFTRKMEALIRELSRLKRRP